MSKIITIVATAAMLSVGMLSAHAETLKIGFITKFPAEFFAVLENGGKAYAAANPGIDIVFGQAKSATDAEGEIAIIESMISQGVKGIESRRSTPPSSRRSTKPCRPASRSC